MSDRIRPALFALTVLLCTAAEAQQRLAKTIEVVLEGCEGRPESMDIRLDGSEAIELLRAGNLWRGDRGSTFNGLDRFATASFAGGRTNCVKSDLQSVGGSAYVAKFRMRCASGSVASVQVIPKSAKRELPVSWLRMTPAEKANNKFCEEKSSTGVVTSVASQLDNLYVHFGSPEKLSFSQYHLEIKRGEFRGRRIEGSVVVKKPELISEFCLRRSNCAANQLDIFEKYHLDRGFQSVELRTKK